MDPDMFAYDPDRVVGLRDRTRQAIDALLAASSGDPAAVAAMQVVRGARTNLEDRWMPLLEHLVGTDAMIGWTATGPVAISSRSSDALIAAYEDAAERLSVGPPGEVEEAWDEMAGVLAEIARLAATDPELAADVVAQIGLHELLMTADLARQLARSYMGPDWSIDDWRADVAEPVGTILASAIDADARLGDGLLAAATRYPMVAELVAADLTAFDPVLVVTLASAMVVPPELFDDRERVDAAVVLVSAMVARPQLALDLLTDAPAREAILVDGRLDDDELTAALVESGLGTAVVRDPALLARGGRALDDVVRLAADHQLTTGARHGLAVAFAPYLRTLNHNSVMDDAGAVELVTSDEDDANGSVTIEELQAVFGEILSDEDGQVLFMEVLTQYGDELLDTSLDRATAGADDARIDGPLRRYAELLDLALDSIGDENARLAAAAAARNAARADILTLLGAGLALAGSPTSIGVGVLAALLPDESPQEITSSYVRQRAFNDATVGYIERVLDSPAMRRRVGWWMDDEDEARLAELAAAYRAAVDVVAADKIVLAMTNIVERTDNGEAMNDVLAGLGLADDG